MELVFYIFLLLLLIVGPLGVIMLIVGGMGWIALLVLGSIGGDIASSGCSGYQSDTYMDDPGTDEWLKPCTHEWRSSHPIGYNQFTGGWDAQEDEENGW